MKRRKRIVAAAAGVICMMASVFGPAAMPDVYAQDEAAVSAAPGSEAVMIPSITISVGEGQKTPQYTVGNEANLMIRLTNTGSADAGHVKVTPVLDNAENWPFVIEEMNYDRSIEVIKAGEYGEVSWKFMPREDVGTKMYRLDFRIVYDDGQNQYYVGKYVYVNMKGKEKPAENPDTQTPADNGGGAGQVKPSDSSKPDDSADAGGGSVPAGSFVGDAGGVINEGAGASSNPSVPRVIVTGFTTDPGEVTAGASFKLIVHVKNTAKWTAVSNMLFDFQAPSSGTDAAAEAPAFLPSSGSSSVFYDSIPAGETRDISIDLTSRADLAQKPYSIVMTAKYEDSKAASFDSTASLAIPVVQKAKFELSDIELTPESISVGEEANLTCSLYNTGRVKLYNVKASFAGAGVEGKEVFLGNLDPGATGSIDAMLMGTAESYEENNTKLIITYEDENGKQSKEEKQFTLSVMPQKEATDMVIPPEQKGGLPLLPIIVILIAAAGVIAALVIGLKRKKKKKAQKEEEDLMDEVDRFIEDEHTKS